MSDDTDDAILIYIAAHSSFNFKYYKHEVNKGKGAALYTGITNTTGEYFIIQDADLEYEEEKK